MLVFSPAAIQEALGFPCSIQDTLLVPKFLEKDETILKIRPHTKLNVLCFSTEDYGCQKDFVCVKDGTTCGIRNKRVINT